MPAGSGERKNQGLEAAWINRFCRQNKFFEDIYVHRHIPLVQISKLDQCKAYHLLVFGIFPDFFSISSNIFYFSTNVRYSRDVICQSERNKTHVKRLEVIYFTIFENIWSVLFRQKFSKQTCRKEHSFPILFFSYCIEFPKSNFNHSYIGLVYNYNEWNIKTNIGQIWHYEVVTAYANIYLNHSPYRIIISTANSSDSSIFFARPIFSSAALGT